METAHPSFSATLLRWFDLNGRDLPWRNTKDPYAIWLSEVILQQTRINQGMDYWLRFMQRYPRVDDLAAATEDEVLRLWQGLGYYSRARNLHAAARQIAHRGSFPDTFQEIRQLKGVGDYTAAAVASIAFHRPVAVVDGNVYRVLSRYFGIFTPINSTEGKKEFAALAQSLLPPQAPARYNEALMDFGALQCKPVTAAKASPKTRSNIGETLQPDLFSPSPAVDHSVSAARLLSSAAPSFCAQCPLGEGCVAYREGWVAQLPVKLKKTKVKTRCMTYLYIRCKGHIALRRRGSGDIWQGLWEPVLYKDVEDKSTPAHAAQRKEMPLEMETSIAPSLAALPFQTIEATSRCVSLRHVLTHRILLADFYTWDTDVRPALPPEYIWIREEDIDQYAIPRLVELFLEAVSQ